MQKNGWKKNRQQYRCPQCNHQFSDGRGGSRVGYLHYYEAWLFGRRTLEEISHKLGISYPTLQQEFDRIEVKEGLQCLPGGAINLVVDATFFGRAYGYLCFHDTKRIIWFKEIKTESVKDFRQGLRELVEAGYQFKSVTIDGRRGYVKAIKMMLGPVPVQMCLFHQKAIMRRYLTNKPQSACGRDLKSLTGEMLTLPTDSFIAKLYELEDTHRPFLLERNDKRQFKHTAIRAALRSLHTNMPQLFTFRDIPSATIPTTINHLESTFSHLKEKIQIHRGLRTFRKKKAIAFLLSPL